MYVNAIVSDRSRLFVPSQYSEDVAFALPVSCTVGKLMCLLWRIFHFSWFSPYTDEL